MSNFKKHKAITTYGDLSDKKISKSFWIGKADGYTSKWHIKAKTALASCAPAASGEVQEKKRVGVIHRIGKDGSTLSVFRACHFLTFECKTHTQLGYSPGKTTEMSFVQKWEELREKKPCI